ncbi:MAG: serine/threonine-protein kinase [Polyangiaceae bacterium]
MDAEESSLPVSIGRYEVVRLLGRGAMGRVLLARDPVLSRSVAVKLLRDDLRLPPEQLDGLVERMRQEARASARIVHPNIVSLFDMGEEAEHGLFLVFEYADGSTLKERLKRNPVGPQAAAKLAREIGDALSTAHAAGVLHRDIKPDNIILTSTGSKIADFGIARVPDSTLTRDGGLLGTPAYSAPECILHGTFSPASDQFSMAATLYEALSQTRAFPGADAVAVANRITTEDVSPIAAACGLNPHVDEVLGRALAKNPADRYDSAREFGFALAEGLEVAPRTAMATLPDTRHHELERAAERSNTRLAVGGAAVGALLAVAAMQLTSGLREDAGKPVAASVCPPPNPPPKTYAWLAEGPKTRPKAAPSARPLPSANRAEPHAIVDAGSPAAPTDAGRLGEARPDAAGEPVP